MATTRGAGDAGVVAETVGDRQAVPVEAGAPMAVDDLQ
jgi:hypothetical protein